MAESVCAAVLARLRRDHRLATLPLGAKALWLHLALHATQTEDGVLAVGTAYGLHTGVAMLVQCAEVEVKPNLDILIAAGFVEPIADTAIRIFGLMEATAAPQAPIPAKVVQAATKAPPAPHRHMNGKRGGRPRKDETPQQAFERRQREIMLPVTGGKPADTQKAKSEAEKSWKLAENRQIPETQKAKPETQAVSSFSGFRSSFPSFPRAEVEEKKKENQTPPSPSSFPSAARNLEKLETAMRPVDQEEAMRIASEIGKLIKLVIRPNDRNVAVVRGWMMEGISERTIMRAVAEGIDGFEGSIGSTRFFDGRVRQAHAQRDPDEDLPPEARAALRGVLRDYTNLNPELQCNLDKGTVAKRSKREMMLSFRFDDVFIRWGRPPITFVDRAEYEHWKGVWERGEWVSPYEDERAA